MNMKNLVTSHQIFFASGKTKILGYRKEQLIKLRTVLIQNEKLLIDSIHSDFNKGSFDAYVTEFAMIFHEIEQALRNMERWAAPKKTKTNVPNQPGRSFIMSEPLGSVLVIGAWNYPYQLSLVPAVSAIAAGNTVIIKPSELAANTSKAMAQILNNSFDSEYLYVQEGGVAETTELLEQKFDKIFFTGSTPVGKLVYQAAAKQLTPVTLELGGKSPAFVFPDTNLDVTARRLVWGKFLNAGQTCVAPDYLMVHKSVEEALETGGIEAAKEVCRKTRGPVASIFYQGLDRYNEGLDVVEKSVISYGGVQAGLLESGLSWIALFIALAPMLGFLGTVVGMVLAFDAIEAAGDISPSLVAGGIKVALITTIGGLIAAIVLQVFFNYCTNKIDSIINTMEDASISLLDILVKYNIKK